MTRSLEQNDKFHCMCRRIAKHCRENGANITEETAKELVLLKLGNTKELLGEKVAMRSKRYKRTRAEMTQAEVERGDIPMSELMDSITAWAATDLGLELI